MVKEKQNRTYDQDGFRRRAACLCVHDPLESEVCVDYIPNCLFIEVSKSIIVIVSTIDSTSD